MRISSKAAFVAWIAFTAASTARAATVDAVAKDGKTVTLRLSADEAKSLKAGEKVKVGVGSGAPLEATVTAVRGGKATVTLAAPVATRTSVKRGASATVASASPIAPLSVAPPPAPIATDGPSGAAPYATTMVHPSFVSPAQLHQIDGPRTDGRLGFATANAKMSGPGGTAQANGAGPTLSVAGATRLRGRPVRLGFFLDHGSSSGRVKAGDFNQKFEQSQTVLMPAFAYDARPGLTAALAYQIVQSRFAGEFYSPAHNISYARPIPGVAYHDATLEAGLAFSPRVNEESSVGDTTVRDVQPAVVTLHGAGRIDGATRAFGHLNFNQNRMNNVAGETSWKNNVDFLSGVARDLDSFTTVDGAVTVYLPANNGSTQKTPDNVLRMGLILGMDKKATETARLGASLEYEQASDDFKEDGETVKVSRDALTISARGTLKL